MLRQGTYVLEGISFFNMCNQVKQTFISSLRSLTKNKYAQNSKEIYPHRHHLLAFILQAQRWIIQQVSAAYKRHIQVLIDNRVETIGHTGQKLHQIMIRDIAETRRYISRRMKVPISRANEREHN